MTSVQFQTQHLAQWTETRQCGVVGKADKALPTGKSFVSPTVLICSLPTDLDPVKAEFEMDKYSNSALGRGEFEMDSGLKASAMTKRQ
jgi:hypothetical protein